MGEEVENAAKVFPELFAPAKSTLCTEAFSAFLQEYFGNLDLFFFVVRLVAMADENRVTAAKALIPGTRDSAKRAQYEKTANDPSLTLRQLKKHAQPLSQNLTNGIVSAFQRYFSAIIQQAALRRPEMLRSAEQIRVDDVLRFNRHRDVVTFIVDRKINELAYGGLTELERYFSDRLGIDMFRNDRERSLLRLFVEARNINLHNGGVVNDLFLSRVGTVEGFTFKKGRRFHVDLDALVTLSENAMRVALEIDQSISRKFRMRRKAFKTWRRQIGGADT